MQGQACHPDSYMCMEVITSKSLENMPVIFLTIMSFVISLQYQPHLTIIQSQIWKPSRELGRLAFYKASALDVDTLKAILNSFVGTEEIYTIGPSSTCLSVHTWSAALSLVSWDACTWRRTPHSTASSVRCSSICVLRYSCGLPPDQSTI